MPRSVKRRTYRSPAREAAARATRRAILDAARRLIIEQGYAATAMAEVAARAGVAVDTIYASIGPKPALLRALIETAISATDAEVPAEERDYVLRIHAAPRAADKLRIYAHAITEIQARLAPLVTALRRAGDAERDALQLWNDIAERRARNMGRFATELAATGDLRPDAEPRTVADVLWSTTSAELYELFTAGRGWTDAQFAAWLADAWCRLFLAPGATTGIPKP